MLAFGRTIRYSRIYLNALGLNELWPPQAGGLLLPNTFAPAYAKGVTPEDGQSWVGGEAGAI